MKTLFTRPLVLLLAVCMAVLGLAQALHTNRLEIVIDAPSMNNFQIFYPTDDSGRALLIDQHLYPAGKDVRVLFALKRWSVAELRLHPFDGASSIVLKSVSLSNFFFSSSLSAKDLAGRLTVVQTLEVQDIGPDGVVLKGNSVDPIAVVNLEGIDRSFNYRNTAIGVLTAILVFLLCRKAVRDKEKVSGMWARILLVALACTLAVVFVFYPGFMTYDSVHAVRAARSEVTESVWPPMVSYLWRLVGLVSEDPGAMLFTQVLLFLFSLMWLVYRLTGRFWLAIGLPLSSLALPVLSGTIGALWKDVLMAGLLLAAMAFVFEMRRTTSRRRVWMYFVVALVLMLVASGSRHNAITAVVPIAFYAAWVLVEKENLRSRVRGVVVAGLIGAVTVGAVYAGKLFFDRYSLPQLRPLAGTGSFFPVVRGMDLFAASLCLQKNLLETHSPRLTLDDIARDFDPRHSNNSLKVFEKVNGLGSDEFNRIWWRTLREHPICLLSNKVLLAMHVLGATMREQFLLISPQVDLNEFGYYLEPSPVRTIAIYYVVFVSDYLYLRPWLFFVLSFPAMAFLASRRTLRLEHLVLFSSSMLYALGIFLFGNAADARLLFYSNALNVVLVCMAIAMWWSKPSGELPEPG